MRALTRTTEIKSSTIHEPFRLDYSAEDQGSTAKALAAAIDKSLDASCSWGRH